MSLKDKSAAGMIDVYEAGIFFSLLASLSCAVARKCRHNDQIQPKLSEFLTNLQVSGKPICGRKVRIRINSCKFGLLQW